MVAKSHIFSEIMNSVCGIVYTRNRYAQIVGRGRSTPVDRNTNRLELVRAEFSAAVDGYQDLTTSERSAWDAYAEQTPWKGALGDTIYLTGQAMYIATRCVTRTWSPNIPVAQYKTAPPVPGLCAQPTITTACCPDPTSGIIVKVQNNDSSVIDALVYPSPPKQPSKIYYNGPYQFGRIQHLAVIDPEEVRASACFEGVLGTRIFFMIRAWISIAPYVIAQPTYATALCCIEEVKVNALGAPTKTKPKPKPPPPKENSEEPAATTVVP